MSDYGQLMTYMAMTIFNITFGVWSIASIVFVVLAVRKLLRDDL